MFVVDIVLMICYEYEIVVCEHLYFLWVTDNSAAVTL